MLVSVLGKRARMSEFDAESDALKTGQIIAEPKALEHIQPRGDRRRCSHRIRALPVAPTVNAGFAGFEMV